MLSRPPAPPPTTLAVYFLGVSLMDGLLILRGL